ncbi:MAG: lipopolysaccharide biosynthesis protein [Lachnospiraceae bacterium]
MRFFDKIKSITGDLMYSMLGLIVMNGVIQLVLYPQLNRYMGEERFGVVLTLISIVAIMGSTFGTGANYSRMVTRKKGTDSNGDYNIFLLIIAGLSVIVSLVGLLWLGEFTPVAFIGFLILMILTVIRYYSDVEFRLNLNYKRFFIYYLLIAAGYVAGVLLYPLTNSWIFAMILGEGAAVAFVIIAGGIFKRPLFAKSEHFGTNMKSIMIMSGTDLIAALVLNSDRILLQAFAGGVAVTVFYAATLIGKMMSLISTPLNGVIIGHLNRYDGGLSYKTFGKICGASILLGAVMNVFCVGVSYVFVKIMYPDIFDMVVPYLWLANAGQIFYFISNTLTVVLMRFTDEKYQLYINVTYLVVFLVLAVPMTYMWKLMGMAVALLIVNTAKILIIALFGCVQLKKKA